MRRLDGPSAFLFYNDIPACYQHTLKIAVLDLSESENKYDHQSVIALFERALNIFPMLRWKIAKVPFGLNHPVWVEDLDFDISHHVRRIACPKPANKAAFCQLVSELYAHSLDKSLPLWETWVVEGLEDDKVALVTMLHHAYADGIGAGLLVQGAAAPENHMPQTSHAYGVNPDRNPTRLTLLIHGLIDLPMMFIREIPPLVRAAIEQRKLEKAYVDSGKTMPPKPRDAPDSPLNTAYSHGRSFAYETYDLDEFIAVSKFFQVTVNDLLVAIITGAIRSYYVENGWSPDRPLVAVIPVNMRTAEQKQKVLGNVISNSQMSLPIHQNDALKRLHAVQKSGQAMKDHMKATGGTGLIRAAELVPPIIIDLLNWVLRRSEGQFKLLGNLVISNVPGSKEPLHFGTAKVDTWLSIGQVMGGVGLNITAWSYAGQFNICLMADKHVIPNGSVFLGHLSTAYLDYKTLFASQNASGVASGDEVK